MSSMQLPRPGRLPRDGDARISPGQFDLTVSVRGGFGAGSGSSARRQPVIAASMPAGSRPERIVPAGDFAGARPARLVAELAASGPQTGGFADPSPEFLTLPAPPAFGQGRWLRRNRRDPVPASLHGLSVIK